MQEFTDLSLHIVGKTNVIEITDDLFWSDILLDLSICIETNHVAGCHGGCQFQDFVQPFFLDLGLALGREGDNQVHSQLSRLGSELL